jgi:hypothetical protein
MQIRVSGWPPAGERSALLNHDRTISKEKCVVKVFSGFHHLARCAFFLLLAAPAFAQFEVSPDHFDGPPPVKKTASTQKHNAQNNSTHQTTAKARNSKMQRRATFTRENLHAQEIGKYSSDHRDWHAQGPPATEIGNTPIGECTQPEGTSLFGASRVNP